MKSHRKNTRKFRKNTRNLSLHNTIDVASNHNVTTVGQPTGQTPDTFSIVDTAEKVVDLDIVDSTLLPSQQNTDNRPTTDDPGEVKASP